MEGETVDLGDYIQETEMNFYSSICSCVAYSLEEHVEETA